MNNNNRTKNKSLLEYEKKSKEQTKKRIIDAIETLKNSLRKISITAIAKESGVSRPTLYIYKDFINEHFESVKTISDLTIKEIEVIVNENIRLKKILEELGHKDKCNCKTCKTFNK